MSNTNKAKAADTVIGTEETAVAVAPLVCFPFMGRVCFVVHSEEDRARADAEAAENNYMSYYLLGAAATKERRAPAIFKVTRNTVNLAVGAVTDAGDELWPVAEIAYFRLPKLPWELVAKIDSFFRRVDAAMGGSEAIVVLGFDTRLDDGRGWRIIVPEQENSAASCHYHPASVVEMIPEDDIDHIQIVGTCHSHPKMGAFCSGTDRNDQVGNDGLHITFGWTTANKTDFHAEFQVAGVAYAIKDLDLIFDTPEDPAEYPEFSSWMARVKKETPHWSGATVTGSGWATGGRWSNSASTAGSKERYSISHYAPDIKKYTIVAEFSDDHAKTCPVCFNFLDEDQIADRRCPRCLSYLLMPEETLDELSDKRRARRFGQAWQVDPEVAEIDIAVWRRAGKPIEGEIHYLSAGHGKKTKGR